MSPMAVGAFVFPACLIIGAILLFLWENAAAPAKPALAPRPARRSLALNCPHCEGGRVEVAKRVWFIRGMLLAARWGSRVHVGCRRCVDQAVSRELVGSLVLGWWCFPWGIGTPLVVAQNLFALVLPNRAFTDTLDEVLVGVGVSRADVEVDEHGFTREEKRLFKIAAAVLAEAMWVDGDAHKAEYETAVAILGSLSDGKVSATEAARALELARNNPARLDGLPWDFRVLLLHIAADTVAADHHVAAAEATFLYDLAGRLDLDQDIVGAILARLTSVAGSEFLRRQDPDLVRACSILGIDPDASPNDIRRRYRALMMKVHPDHVSPDERAEAHRLAADANWAYEYVLKAAA
jgi:DnaJ-domain-containing protein 1